MNARTCHSNRLGNIQVDFENLIDHFFGGAASDRSTPAGGCQIVPRANVSESDKQYTVVLELPGVASDQVDIELKDDQLVVSGTKAPVEYPDGEKSVRSERLSGKFRRVFEFGSPLNGDEISATFQHGLLTITLGKSPEVLPRKIEITMAK